MSIRPEVCTLYSRADMSMNLQLQHSESAPGPGFLFLQQCFSFNRVQQPDLCGQKQSEFEACQPQPATAWPPVPDLRPYVSTTSIHTKSYHTLLSKPRHEIRIQHACDIVNICIACAMPVCGLATKSCMCTHVVAKPLSSCSVSSSLHTRC